MTRPAAAAALTGASIGQLTQSDSAADLVASVKARVRAGDRFAGLMGTQRPDGLLLSVHLASEAGIATYEALLPPGTDSYPALAPAIAAASWYERQLHDMFGVVPAGQLRLEPLTGAHAPARQVSGPGMFTIPHGPVRSGVTESIEYLVETPGEEIPHLTMRVCYKHRGVERRFAGLPAATGVLLAERAEGVASVAHALAFCHAAEEIAGVTIPRRAGLVRVLHAELERIAAHLDAALRLSDSAGLAVATARLGLHKERVLRLVGQLCGSRFGRGVVVPGGVAGPPGLPAAELADAAARLHRAITSDAQALMTTASFLDRLRGTGPLPPELAREHGALGPIGRASGFAADARSARPYAAYPELGLADPPVRDAGDAMARLAVRWDEVQASFALIRAAAVRLGDLAPGPAQAEVDQAAGDQAAGDQAAGYGHWAQSPDGGWTAIGDGRAVGWAEAPQGEVLYDLRIEDGLISRCHPRSASFHNLPLFGEVFAGDILTDFPFIEASFGLCVAGVSL